MSLVDRGSEHAADLIGVPEQEGSTPLLRRGMSGAPLPHHATRCLGVERVVQRLGGVEIASEPRDEGHGALVAGFEHTRQLWLVATACNNPSRTQRTRREI